MLNRDALIIRLKQPFIDWINAADPHPDPNVVSLEFANESPSIFLIHDGASGDIDSWLSEFYLPLFERILEEWYVDDSLWPQDRSLELFLSWCEVEVYDMVFDLMDEPLLDDELD